METMYTIKSVFGGVVGVYDAEDKLLGSFPLSEGNDVREIFLLKVTNILRKDLES